MRMPERSKTTRRVRPTKLEILTDSDGNLIIPDWTTYRLLAGITESIPALWSEESTPSLRLVHHGIGIVTELDELLPREEMLGLVADNWEEELGDLFWYLACIHTVLIEQGMVEEELSIRIAQLLVVGHQESTENSNHKVFTLRLMQADAARLLNNVKRLHAYGDGSLTKEDADKIIWGAYSVISAAIAYCLSKDSASDTIVRILERNITKLSKRYPKGFNPTDAINRKLEAEAEVFKPKKQQAIRGRRASVVGAAGEQDASV